MVSYIFFSVRHNYTGLPVEYNRLEGWTEVVSIGQPTLYTRERSKLVKSSPLSFFVGKKESCSMASNIRKNRLSAL